MTAGLPAHITSVSYSNLLPPAPLCDTDETGAGLRQGATGTFTVVPCATFQFSMTGPVAPLRVESETGNGNVNLSTGAKGARVESKKSGSCRLSGYDVG